MLRKILGGLLLLWLFTCWQASAMASTAVAEKWSEHTGSYLGARIGFNFSNVEISNYISDRHGTYSQSLLGGYIFRPNWAIEASAGSYFSSFGLGLSVSVKRIFPLTDKFDISLQAGGNYISTFFTDGFVGPYVGGSLEYALSKSIAVNLDASDIISSVTLGNNLIVIHGNFLTFLVGFSYYLNN